MTACANSETINVQSATPHLLQAELAALSGLSELAIPQDRADSLIRDCRDDAAADALIMSQTVGAPVAVWLDSDNPDRQALGRAQQYDLSCTSTDSNPCSSLSSKQHSASSCAPILAQLLIHGNKPFSAETQQAFTFPYRFDETSIAAPESGYQPGELSTVQNTFARESWMDELANEQQQDPVHLRKDKIEDDRGRDIIDSVTQQAELDDR